MSDKQATYVSVSNHGRAVCPVCLCDALAFGSGFFHLRPSTGANACRGRTVGTGYTPSAEYFEAVDAYQRMAFTVTVGSWTLVIMVPVHAKAPFKTYTAPPGTVDAGSTLSPDPPKSLLRLRDHLRTQGLTDCEITAKTWDHWTVLELHTLSIGTSDE